MIRIALTALVFSLSTAAAAWADSAWALKMFEVSTHDFGTVARGSKAVCSFRVKNIYKETVHIASVRSSCNCTAPTISKDTLATYETGEIIAQFNTRSFLGHKNATLTVVFDQPTHAEVQLRVEGVIRSDVVFNPGAVQFGSIEQGAIAEQRVSVAHAGREDWAIVDVQSTNDQFEVEMEELSCGGGRTNYELLVRLKNDTPAGYLNDELILVTNDASAPRIPLGIEGRVNSDLTVTPSSLFLGEIAPGQKVSKKLVVRSKQPFKILKLECANKGFEFEASEEAKAVHLVTVTFLPDVTGKVEEKIQILTDRGAGVTAALTAHATVQE